MSGSEHPWPESLSTRERLEGRIARLLAGLPGAWLLKLIGETPLVVEGRTLDAHVQFILAARRKRRFLLLTEPTPADGRRRYRREIQAVAVSSGARPTRVQSVQDLTIDGGAVPLAARHYTPLHSDATARKPLLVYLHGGGFVLGDLETHDEPCRMLCHHADMHVLSVAYRLAPEHPFPAAHDDACTALAWAQRHADSLGADSRYVCIGGDSAGGTLSAAAALAAARDGRAPAAQLLIYPATNNAVDVPTRQKFSNGFMLTAQDMEAFSNYYLGADPATRRDPRASPALSPDHASSPPTMITTAGYDPLCEEGDAYADTLRMAGVTVRARRMDGLVHGYLHMTTASPAANAAVIDTARQFRALLTDLSRKLS